MVTVTGDRRKLDKPSFFCAVIEKRCSTSGAEIGCFAKDGFEMVFGSSPSSVNSRHAFPSPFLLAYFAMVYMLLSVVAETYKSKTTGRHFQNKEKSNIAF